MATVRPVETVRVDVGKPPIRTEKTYELQKVPVDSLSESPNFVAVVAIFSCLRMLRPILLVSVFAGGPQDDDGVASAAVTLNWIASIMGILGAVLISSPCLDFAKHSGASPWFTWRLEPAALAAFAIAASLDLVHQLLAAISWEYFWSTGVEPEDGGNDMLSFILVLLHIIGLIGLLGMIAAYGRCFRASLTKFENGPPPGYGDNHAHSSVGMEDPEEGLRKQSNHASKSSPPQEQSATDGPRQAATAGQTKSATPTDAPPRANSMGSATSSSSPPSPRAWFWTDSEWVPVRIMRTSPDGIVVVRLPGGSVVKTIQELLRPRAGIDEEPPSCHPFAEGPFGEGPTAHGQDETRKKERRRPTWGASGHVPPDDKSLPKRPSSAPSASRQTDDSEGAKWAGERLASLRKELQALDGKPLAERRQKLRALQRELHPDKQPPELRAYTQPLFMLVQREWELDEAVAKAAQATN